MPCIRRPPVTLTHASFRVHSLTNRLTWAGPPRGHEPGLCDGVVPLGHAGGAVTYGELLDIDPHAPVAGDSQHGQATRMREADVHVVPRFGRVPGRG